MENNLNEANHFKYLFSKVRYLFLVANATMPLDTINFLCLYKCLLFENI